ncbi:GIY-YIG nuclease family protein [Thalassobaculum sp. OXR-137]|uniref:GIY-YIG nuclease family protein n=1 Tax=Thalassobaculum sp. OXR-137 TaxID=3100173 RepID=UPI002AC91418|nr:GIY-YIG nuclease family protein [Thalassobaculum sp. OXR-137]WPZ32927.1 GIY-YIG nuclease family protein [Thalassobaculum sp. OXR-137]
MLPTVYIVTNKTRGTLYIGVTSNPARRISQHRRGEGSAFASKYKLRRVVYYEHPPTMEAAIRREKQLKNWHRDWKIALIEQGNPEWLDLWPGD